MTEKAPRGVWAKVSVRLLREPATVRAGGEAALYFIAALSYCKEMEVDGVIPAGASRVLAGELIDDVPAARAACVREGLLVEDADALVVPNWLEWNDSAEQIAENRRKERERKAALRASRKASRRDTRGDAPRDTRRDSAPIESESESESDLDQNLSSQSGPDSEEITIEEHLALLLLAMGEDSNHKTRERLEQYRHDGATLDDFADLRHALTIREVKHPKAYVFKSLQERVDQRQGA